ncbi:MAG: ABC transporter substrate-binding protein [Spirochaetaceae bacterium]|nr:ABC transporter substrate-binding protein [Spirochaetaceae bacterium]
MKRLVVFCLFCAVGLAPLCAEGQRQTKAAQQIRIGIAKIVQHEALDACERGIQDELESRGINAVFDLQNANGDLNTAAQIANKFKNERVSVAVAIATPIAVAMANAIQDIPVVFCTVTDPVAAGLVSSLERGQGNVTGLSDALPTGEHLALFKEIAGIKTLGYIYTSSEANSLASLQLVEEVCKTYGITLITQAISLSSELRQACEAIVNRVDGIYLTTDNTVFSALPALLNVFNAAKKPVFSSDLTAVYTGGALIASGFNYYKAGRATGVIVADILAGRKPADIPVKLLTDPSESDLLFDLDAAARCGISIPQRYLDQAGYIFKDGQLITK